MANFFLICLIEKLISLAIAHGIFQPALAIPIETSLQYIFSKSTHHISWFQVSGNDKQAVIKTSSTEAVRSSGETYSKLRASFPHDLSKVAGDKRKTSTSECARVLTNFNIPATDEADHNYLAMVYFHFLSTEWLGARITGICSTTPTRRVNSSLFNSIYVRA